MFVFLALFAWWPASFPSRSARARVASLFATPLPGEAGSSSSILAAALLHHSDCDEVRVVLSARPADIRIVWLGSTRSRLDSCGCGQSVTLPKVASVLRRLSAGPPRTLLLDAGRAVAGDTPLDRERMRTYAAVLKGLSFEALVVDAHCEEFVCSLADMAPPLLTLSHPPHEVHVGARPIALVVAASPPDTRATERQVADPQPELPWTRPPAIDQVSAILQRPAGRFQVVVGDLSQEDAQAISALSPALVLSSRVMATGERLTDGSGFSCDSFRIRLGRTSVYGVSSVSAQTIHYVELASDGEEVAFGRIDATAAAAEDDATKALVEAFFRKLASDPSLVGRAPRRFFSEARENDPLDGYVGVAACQKCHAAQTKQWEETRHSTAIKTLEAIDRHYDPSCVTCHSTGFGWESGYRPRDPSREALRDVGCETCHGPGGRHAAAPKEPGLVRRGSIALCVECHDGKDAKPLGDHLHEAFETIRH